MSAIAYLEFVAGLVIAAVLWALVSQATNDLQSEALSSADTTAGSTGADWLGTWISWMPLWVVLLLAFGLIVAVVVRRRGVFA